MTDEELATERNEVREILECFSEELSQSNIDKLSRVFCIINGDEKRIKDLKKENAELKESNKMLEQGYVWHDYDAGEDCYEDSHEGKWVKRDEVYQLTKAKELIKTLLSSKTDFDERRFALWAWKEEVNKAEQFLKNDGCPDVMCEDCTKEDCGVKKLGLVGKVK